jgi:hypothetical protein
LKFELKPRSIDWRVWLGLGLTVAWLLLGILYIESTVGWDRFVKLRVDQLGSFLEGAFAPLAFLWLVIGYFLQQRELQQNTRVLQAQLTEVSRSAEQAVIQSEKMAANEVHARQETFLRIAQNVRGQLGTIMGFLFISSQGANADGRVSGEEQARLFSHLSLGDSEVFSRRMLETYIVTRDPQARYDLFYGTPVRARHSNNYVHAFERLIRRAEEVDTDGLICDALYSTAHGLVYRIIKRHQQEAPAELADRERTGVYIEF